MDANRFDALVRSLRTPARRRRFPALALGGVGALGTLLGWGEAEAKKKKKKKKKKKNQQQPPPASPPPPPPPPPPSPTCTDGSKNGNESDVDCGGICGRCGFGRTCLSRNDCITAYCNGISCDVCASSAVCGLDSAGPCICDVMSGVCGNQAWVEVEDPADSCFSCPPGTAFCVPQGFGIVRCHPYCGTTFDD